MRGMVINRDKLLELRPVRYVRVSAITRTPLECSLNTSNLLQDTVGSQTAH
jgi:hypothetical protein